MKVLTHLLSVSFPVTHFLIWSLQKRIIQQYVFFDPCRGRNSFKRGTGFSNFAYLEKKNKTFKTIKLPIRKIENHQETKDFNCDSSWSVGVRSSLAAQLGIKWSCPEVEHPAFDGLMIENNSKWNGKTQCSLGFFFPPHLVVPYACCPRTSCLSSRSNYDGQNTV